MNNNISDKKEQEKVQKIFTDGYIVYACLTVLVQEGENSFTPRQEAGVDSFWIEKTDAINRAQEIMNYHKRDSWEFLFYKERDQLAWVHGPDDSIAVYPMKVRVE